MLLTVADTDSESAVKEPESSKKTEQSEKRKAYWIEKKNKKKLNRRSNETIPVVLDMSDEMVLYRREKQLARRERFSMALAEGHQVVIDCGFEDLLTDKERKSLAQQIMFSYGVNRRSETPLSVMLTSLRGMTLDALNNITGFDAWQSFHPSTECYTIKFKEEALVYLTADSPNVLSTLSRDKVYVIGGIVDRNRLKGATYKKASTQNIATARLPLQEVVDMGSYTRVLTVNHVFAILVYFAQLRDWKEAALKALPSRKVSGAK
uniref:tRNA (guanine(9)-N(1))-methyltransferase n=1 Tax=Albugo laibachii Nc14 TaxID=890382 RepID=F0WGA4_9STRA|nr:RNA (guanine9)methyltransferase domaincontaining protein putative [Albugo laibachii Nc14]|eukprot:CCA20239.1 RNA (guanine9)methyltransferase domaincontaining protein putative [Albugo laibachii Nc14]